MIQKPNNVIRIKCPLDKTFFTYWLRFLEPFHSLTAREIDLLAVFLLTRYKLSKVISDDALLSQVVMNEDTKRQIREECDLSIAHFLVIMGKFKKHGVIVDNRINPKYIPNITEEKGFQLLFYFELDEQLQKSSGESSTGDEPAV